MNNKLTDEELEKYFVFCILKGVIPQEKICEVFESLIKKCWRGGFFKSFHLNSKEKMLEILDVDTTELLLKNNWIIASELRQWSKEGLIRMAEGITNDLADQFIKVTRGNNG